MLGPLGSALCQVPLTVVGPGLVAVNWGSSSLDSD